MASEQVGLRIDTGLLAEIDRRAKARGQGRPDQIRDDLAHFYRALAATREDPRGYFGDGALARDMRRYQALLKAGRRALREKISQPEVMAVVDVLNGTLFADDVAWRYVHFEIEDALSDGLAGKWGIDGAALVAKLAALTDAEAMALIEAVESFWQQVGEGKEPAREAVLAEPAAPKAGVTP